MMPSEMEVWSGIPSQWLGLKTYLGCGLAAAVALGLVVLPIHALSLIAIPVIGAIAVRRYFLIRSISFRLSSERLFITTGLFMQRTVEVELFRVRDLTVYQGVLDRMVGIGTVQAVTSDQNAPTVVLCGISNPVAVKDALRRHVMEARQRTGTRDIDAAMLR